MRTLSSFKDATEVADMLTREELMESLAWNTERGNEANVRALEEELMDRRREAEAAKAAEGGGAR